MKEAEHKSLSEARGFVPIVTPQQAMLSAKNLPSVPDPSPSSASAAGSGSGEVVDGPQGGKKKDDNTTNSGEPDELECEVSFNTL